MRGLALALALSSALWALPGQAACRLALVMAMDISRSVSPTDFRISREGLAAALQDPAVRRAFLAGEPVAFAVFDWHEPGSSRVVLPWRLIASEADIDATAAEVAGWKRPELVGLTGMGDAMLFAHGLMSEAPPCDARVIDVAADGRVNAGISVASAYASENFAGIWINALAIGEHESGLVPWLVEEVIRGPGAFVEYAPRHTDFPPAIRRKLIRELSVALIGAAEDPPPPLR